MWKKNLVYTRLTPFIQLLFTDSRELSTEKSTVVSNKKVRKMPGNLGVSGLGAAIRANLAQNFGYLVVNKACLLYTSPSPRDYAASRMPSSA